MARSARCWLRKGAIRGAEADVHFMIEAPGCDRLTTHVFVDGDPYLDFRCGVRGQRCADRRLTSGTRPGSVRMDAGLRCRSSRSRTGRLRPSPDQSGSSASARGAAG